MPHEIITLQFGQLANFTGSHFWNIQARSVRLLMSPINAVNSSANNPYSIPYIMQDQQRKLQDYGFDDLPSPLYQQIDSNVLYNQRIRHHGTTGYTPRLLIIDAKGSLGGMSLSGGGTSSPRSTWQGDHEVHRAPPIHTSEYIKHLENSPPEEHETTNEGPSRLQNAALALQQPGAVKHFTDYLDTPLSTRNTHICSSLWQNAPELSSWSRDGGWLDTDEMEAVTEKIRSLAEECDSLGGFQCFIDGHIAFSGVSYEVLQELHDDYGSSRAIVSFTLSRNSTRAIETSRDVQRRRLFNSLNTALLTEISDLYIPLSIPRTSDSGVFPHLNHRQGDLYQDGGILAAALDSATLPYRLNTSVHDPPIGAVDIWSYTSLFNSEGSGRGIAGLSLALPCAPLHYSNDVSSQEKRDGRMMDTVTKNEEIALTTHGVVNLTNLGEEEKCQGVALRFLCSPRDPERFAECTTLRGARDSHTNSTAPLDLATTFLDDALAREGVRCVQHRTVVAGPLPLPLSFPQFFGPTITTYGDVLGNNSSIAGVGTGHHRVKSCPVLVRVAGSRSVGRVTKAMAGGWKAISNSAGGQASLDSWGVDAGVREEVEERLLGFSVGEQSDEDED